MRLVVAPEMRPEPLHQRCNAEGLQIIVEVFPVRHEQPDRDALRDRPAREREPCVKARAVVIAGDVKTLEAVWQTERAKVRGGQRRNTRKVRKNGAQRQHGLDAFAGGENDARDAEADPVAMQFAKRLSWLRQIRLAAAVCAKPGAMHAGDAAVKIGHAGNERRQGLGLDAAFGAVIAVGQEAEGWIIEIGGDAAAPQIGFGDGACNGACERKEACSGFVGLAVRARFAMSCAAGLTSLSRRLIQKGAGLVKGLAQSGKAPIETDKIEKIAMFSRCGVRKFPAAALDEDRRRT